VTDGPDVTDVPVEGGERWRRRRLVEAPPDMDVRSYYGQPVVRAPHWRRLEIGGYLFLGGLAGGSSLLAAGADVAGLPLLARRSKVVAGAAVTAALGALVRDLGRPSRFVNMLRTFKPTSPMSMGSWLLAAYAPAAIGAAIAPMCGPLRRFAPVATTTAAALAPGVAAYTAVLLGDTAVPAWHDARELPFAFVASSAIAAGGAGVLLTPVTQAGPARRLGIVGTVGEIAVMALVERQLGSTAAAYREGVAGRLVRAGRMTAVAGAVAALLGRSWRPAAGIGGAAMVAGSLLFRLGVLEAGHASADDPAFVVGPQRQRLLAGERATG
jgi:formate-dependent nitrite reductase membrane component NrfD